jgi:hypothetical protein
VILSPRGSYLYHATVGILPCESADTSKSDEVMDRCLKEPTSAPTCRGGKDSFRPESGVTVGHEHIIQYVRYRHPRGHRSSVAGRHYKYLHPSIGEKTRNRGGQIASDIMSSRAYGSVVPSDAIKIIHTKNRSSPRALVCLRKQETYTDKQEVPFAPSTKKNYY